MLYVYGPLMPLRVLEEVRFWKNQEKEHTTVIRELLPNLEEKYVRLMKEWEHVFARTEAKAQEWIEAVIRSPLPVDPAIVAQIRSLVHASVTQSQQWIRQLFALQEQSRAVQMNPTAPVVVQHIIRESEYFLGILQVVATTPPNDPLMPVHWRSQNPLKADPHSAVGEAPRSSPAGEHSGPYAAGAAPAQAPASASASEEERRQIPLLGTGEGAWSDVPAEREATVPIGGHQLPPLPYPYDALEPYIDAETMRLHHDKHHRSYVEGLNKAETELAKARETNDFALIKHWERELAFNGAGHYLHTIFWNVMSPNGGGRPTGPAAEEINKAFGGFDRFQRQFSAAAEKVEGGGWALLVWSPRSRRVEILQSEKHQNLSQWDVIPLFVLDVWEHAYYLKYRTERAQYIKAWWNVVNWRHVNERLAAARQVKWPPY
jgi:Fe-Mn family superoxide dismutase